MSVTAIKDKAQYRVTIHADEEFLLSENTVYPVWIDPTIKVSDNTHGVNAIEDIAIYSGVPTSNCNWQYLICGYADSAYKVGRILIRTPGLTSNAEFQSASKNSITSAKFYIRDASGTAGYPVYLYANTGNASWTESGATWNNAGVTLGTKYSTVSPGSNAYAAFDITELVKSWKSSTTAAQRGFVLVSSDESSKNRSFCSSEFSDANSRPYIVVNYQSAAETVDVLEGATVTLSATGISGTITWASETPAVASINSTTGVVTGIKAGYSRVTASVNGNVEKTFHVYVRIGNGVYYLKNNLSGYYLGLQDSGIDYNTPAKQQAKVTTNPGRYSQLWKITYIDQGFYSVRPMHRLNMGLNLTDTTVDIWGATTNDTLSALLTTTRWTITKSGTGYVFNNYGLSNKAMVPYGLSTSINAGITVGTDNGSTAYKWTLEAPTSTISNQVIFYDAENKTLATSPSRLILQNETKTLSELNLYASFVSTATNVQNIQWSSISTTTASVDQSTGSVTGIAANEATKIYARQIYEGITYLRYYSIDVLMVPEGVYYIANKETLLYADIANQTMANGTTIHQWQYSHVNSQKWRFDYVGDGYYTIQSTNSTAPYYMGIENDSTSEYADVVLRSGTIADGMKWSIDISDTSGGYILTPKTGIGTTNAPDKVLAVQTGIDAVNGAALSQISYYDDTYFEDEWYLEEINSINVIHFYDEGYLLREPNIASIIQQYHDNVASVYKRLFDIDLRGSIHAYTSICDNCKMGADGVLSLSELNSGCENEDHLPYNCTHIERLIPQMLDDLSGSSEKTILVLWTGHDMEVPENSIDDAPCYDPDSRLIIMTRTFLDQSNDYDIHEYNTYTLFHEIAHFFGTHDHYCYYTSGNVCENPYCDGCVIHYSEDRSCIMDRDIELFFENQGTSMFCDDCQDIIEAYIEAPN